ncbi:mannose-1-phosphate guanylyltransferase/mannose-6-phosphate isomerase [Halomonas sp. HP20-15]|uniref:mannose-1-phosphate guanylyltransferase/mannose-6-phosphate isomerase n=1 Tax=Halomonas sp. HP20-15 TaxID=3085901 RepID=UPI002981E65C|nr:mannose-1-phosphate guanylyltransferase/mannose-6-phosphate isomerase [Halomonas sp. HP20-15]MDW5377029.1 mannose-1-phosphate guanylyltransferase/mannose-6-phosphate isomerase [Halomonas sp. HP20-15]
MITPVILAGGNGSRLWPLSRQLRPKQFLSLFGEASMLQESLQRLIGLRCRPPIVICNEEHRFLVADQLRQANIGDACIILEPEGRNTAPAIALAALRAMEDNPESVLLVLAADHLIEDVAEFHKSIESARLLAVQGELVTFGIVADHAETGYGYIQRGPTDNEGGYRVKRFVEKPDKATAEDYLATGDYYWNSGMFMFQAQCYLDELESFEPEIVHACRAAIKGARRDLDFVRLDQEAFKRCPGNSIDYAVMERTQRACMVPLDAGWSDVGSWSALWQIGEQDNWGNVTHGDAMYHESHNLLVHSENRLVAAVGVDDLVIVETKDAVLVAHKDHVQDVKKIVEQLKRENRSEFMNHREVYRPWGVYDCIDHGERYQVKRITVKPGAKLSVQMHHHRSEHWVVVSGSAQVTVADKTYLVSENESTYIPIGQVHALENPGKIPLELIEVQSGSYLGEDDIVRLDDRYGRCQ